MELFLKQAVNSLSLGSIYALIAVGYTMVYGVVRLINFAHGEIMMFGSYFAFFIATSFALNLPFLVVVVIAMILAAILGISIERVAYKPLRKAPRLSALITAIGMSLFLQNLALLLFKPEPRVYPELVSKTPVNILGLDVPTITIVTVLMSVGFMIALSFFIKNTKPGKAMRAVALDKEASTMMGINVDGIITLTFAIGSSLGALAGVLYGIQFTQVYPTLGVMPGLKAFVAAVLGGIGSVPGAMLGGYIIGLVEIMTKAYISSAWANAIVFSILIIVLLLKPSGILGKNIKEKV